MTLGKALLGGLETPPSIDFMACNRSWIAELRGVLAADSRSDATYTLSGQTVLLLSFILVAVTAYCILRFEADSLPRPAEHARLFFNHCLGMSIRHTLLGRPRMAAAEERIHMS